MGRIQLRAGAEIDVLSAPELREELNRYRDSRKKHIRTAQRLPQLNVVGANPFAAGGDSAGTPQAPRSGYSWSVRHLVIEGLTTGATPDVVNILVGQRIYWQLNGNQFCQTWGRGEILVRQGMALAYQSVGTFAATGAIVIHGLADEVAAEFEHEFYD